MDDVFDLTKIGGQKALDRLINEVLAAGELALDHYRRGASDRLRLKTDLSPVTEADEAVEARLSAHLRDWTPEAGFLGEETGSFGAAEGGLRWVVDPIDGTRAFIRGLPTWSVLVGLEDAGEPVLGIAYMPAAEDLFVGIKGHGAWLNGRPLRVSKTAELAKATISHGALAQFTDLTLGPLLTRLGQTTYTQRGFADFDGYRQLLLGRVDAMVDPGVAPWDICPAAVLVREAGGVLTDLSGAETIHGGSALASNGAVHQQLVELLQD